MFQTSKNTHQYAELHTLVHAVIEQWAEVVGLPPVAALALNDDGDRVPPRVLLPGSIAVGFKIDCERITTRILNDHAELQAAWFAIARKKPVKARVEQQLVKLLGPAYVALSPSRYFRPRRNGSALSHRRAA